METLNIAVSLGISFSLLLVLLVGIILGIIFGVMAGNQEDQALKKKNKRRMWWSFAAPFIVFVFLIIASGLIRSIMMTLK